MSLLAVLLWSTLIGIVGAAAILFTFLPTRHEKLATATPVYVQILVLGDIGRSPRMQYHALSIARHGGRVHLVGYLESPPHPDLLASPNVTIYPLPSPPRILRSASIPFLITGPLKVLWQMFSVLRVLCYSTPSCAWLLVQNPPAIPTLLIALIVSMLRNTRLLIDWHNYGWTILAGTKGHDHPFVDMTKSFEITMGQVAPATHITVTRAMRRELQAEPYDIGSPILTLHDRPAAIFQPLGSATERATFLSTLPETRDFAANILAGETKLIVSSTSWTPDEDFSLLLDALVRYAETDSAQSPIVAIITGKGPEKAYYEQEVQNLQKAGRLPNIQILTAWLSMEDYARLLRCADLGVCLHMSSSGVDLPMKVVDMFGSGLPVAAYSDYESFGELVKEGVNGRGFETADELAAILMRLFSAAGETELGILREGARKESELRWDEEWDRVLGDLFGFTQQ